MSIVTYAMCVAAVTLIIVVGGDLRLSKSGAAIDVTDAWSAERPGRL